MEESTISRADADVLFHRVNALADSLGQEGFERVHIGAAMAGIGLSIFHANGGDFEQTVKEIRTAIEQHQSTRQ